MTADELTDKIKQFSLNEAGFDLVGISGAALPPFHGEALEQWAAEGLAGSMDYMTRGGKRRAELRQTLPSAKSVISLAINYYHPEDPRPASRPVGKVAKYAYGLDYHKLIEKKLKRLTQFIRQTAGDSAEIKSYVDTGPILEKAFATEAGLGFVGKNTNLITRDYGSWVFLASIITDLELRYDAPHTGSCGSCRICIDACPTGALLGNHRMDARRCIAYLTIESKEETPEELKEGIGEWLFGCDICQDVCPYNFRAKMTRHPELYQEKKAGTWVDLEKIQNLSDEEEFRKAFQGSPLKRPKWKGILRNAKVVRENGLQRSSGADTAFLRAWPRNTSSETI